MRELVRSILPAAGALMLAACGPSPEERLAEARKAFDAQDYGAARVAVSAALRKKPGDLSMLALLARTQLRLGDPDGTAVTVGKLRKAGANGPAVSRFEAERRLLVGEPQEALDALGTDATADAWRLRARAQIALERPQEAQASFERGIAAGRDARLYADYVWFKVSAGDLAGAEALLKRLQAFEPQAMETLVVAGDIALRRGRTQEAAKLYGRAASLYPTRFQPMVSLAELYEQQGKLDAAAKAAADAAALQPNHPVINLLQLRLAAKLGQWQTIRQWLQPWGETLDPQTPQLLYYAEALLRLDQPEQARLMLQRVVLVQPDNRHARVVLAEALVASGSPEEGWQTIAPLVGGADASAEEIKAAEAAARAAGHADEANRLRARLGSGRSAQSSTALPQGA